MRPQCACPSLDALQCVDWRHPLPFSEFGARHDIDDACTCACHEENERRLAEQAEAEEYEREKEGL